MPGTVKLFEIPEPDPEQDPTNETRVARIEVLLQQYCTTIGEPRDVHFDASGLSAVFADIRHWCDQHKVDFYQALQWSYDHYLQERS